MGIRQLGLVIAFLTISGLGLHAGGRGPVWQDGELLARRTVPVGRDYRQSRYVYRVHGFNCWYTVVANSPLNLDLYVPMKFAAERASLIIQDSDGTSQKARILRKQGTHRK